MADPRGQGDKERSRLERQLAAAQALTQVGSWEWELSTNVVRWSDELYRIYGLVPQSCDITLDSFLEKVHPDDRERIRLAVSTALERNTPFAYVERIFRPDGSMRYLDSRGEPIVDETGRVRGLLGTCRDITLDRARDEELLRHADIVRNVQIGLSVWHVGNPDDPARTALVTFNPTAERIALRPLGDCLGKSVAEIFPFAAGGRLESLIQEVAHDGTVREATIIGSRDPVDSTRSVSLKAFPLPGSCVGVATEDISERMFAQRMTAMEQRVFELIARGTALSEVLSTLVVGIEEQVPPTIASILLLDPDGKHLRTGAAPSLPESYSHAIEGAEIGENAGSCGSAAARRVPVIVTDIETDPLWNDYREIARAAGLRACTSTPILAVDGRVLGTFALYYRTVQAPSPRARELIDRATYIAGIAIERRLMEEELQALPAYVESAREEERTGIAREIHDELGQSLTAVKMDIAWITRRVQGAASPDPEALVAKLGEMSAMTDQIIDHVRRISSELRPGVLDDLGLLAALEWQGQEFERRSGVTCTIRSSLRGDRALERALSTAVFRVFQETLTNVVRHAEATRVDVRVEAIAGWLELEVADDGRGIAPEAIVSPRSLGLVGIRERIRRLGGGVTVGRGEAGGTVVSVRVPLAGGAA